MAPPSSCMYSDVITHVSLPRLDRRLRAYLHQRDEQEGRGGEGGDMLRIRNDLLGGFEA